MGSFISISTTSIRKTLFSKINILKKYKMAMCGGIGELSSQPHAKLNSFINENVDQIKQHYGGEISKVEVVSYATQIVAGTNYFAKLLINDTDHIHARIFEGLPHTGGAFN